MTIAPLFVWAEALRTAPAAVGAQSGKDATASGVPQKPECPSSSSSTEDAYVYSIYN